MAKQILESLHGSSHQRLPFGSYFAAKSTTHKIIRTRYYWPSIFNDYFEFVRSCDIYPPSSVGHIFILTTTDYFSNWFEAITLKNARDEQVINFLQDTIFLILDYLFLSFLIMAQHLFPVNF